MKRKPVLFVRRTTLGLLLAGAAACGGPPYRADEKDADRAAVADTTVLVALDEWAEDSLELVDHREQVLADGRLKAEIRFVNRASRDLELQLSWGFKDARGFAVEADSPFEHVFIQAGQTVSLARTSRASGAAAFHVQAKVVLPPD